MEKNVNGVALLNDNEMYGGAELKNLYNLLVENKRRQQMLKESEEKLRQEVISLMGDKTACYDVTTLELMFTYLDYADRYVVDVDELRKSAPMIYASHLKLSPGGRRLRVVQPSDKS